MPSDRRTIDFIEKLFRNSLEVGTNVSLGASLYYYVLVKYGPASMRKIEMTAKDLYPTIPKNGLKTGRKELLKKGLIAQIFLTDDADRRFRDSFKGIEAFLPINPKIIYELYKDSIDDIYERNIASEANAGFEELSINYNKVFSLGRMKSKALRSYPSRDADIHNGSNLTLCYGMEWALYNIINNIKNRSEISLMVSGVRIFDEHTHIYKKMLEKELSVKAILLKRSENSAEKARIAMNDFKGKIEFKYAPTQSNATCRKFLVKDAFALDGRKLLPLTKQEPSYIGTIYFDEYSINKITESFNDTWDASEAIH